MTSNIESRELGATGANAPVYTLPARFYTDPTIYEREKEEIFYKSWQAICHVNDVPRSGDFCVGRVADQGVFVIRGKDNALRAFYNVCAHRAHELLRGRGSSNAIVCPYHAWAYNLDGSLRSARHSTEVPCFDVSTVGLQSVKLEVFSSLVFVNLNSGASPLRAQTGDMEDHLNRFIPKLGQLVHAHRITYEVKANWKTIVDNYLECYHCTVAHPAFKDTFDMSSYRHTNFKIHTIQGKVESSAQESGDVPSYTFQSSWWLWPNLFIPRFPDRSALMLCLNIPSSANETTQVWDFYFDSAEPTPAQRDGIAWIDKVAGKEDLDLVESVQRGLRSRGYDRGHLMIDPELCAGWSEHGLWHFQTMIREHLRCG